MPIELRLHPLRSPTAEWRLPLERLELGRDPDCELPFAAASHDMVSWRHARIEQVAGRYLLTDLGSTNKTYVNGQPVLDATVLTVGDQIRLGMEGPRIDVMGLKPPQPIPVQAAASPSVAPAVIPAQLATDRHLAVLTARPVTTGTPLWPIAATLGGVAVVGCLVAALLLLAARPSSLAKLDHTEGVSNRPAVDQPAIEPPAPLPSADPPAAPPLDAAPLLADERPVDPQAPPDMQERAVMCLIAEHPDGLMTSVVAAGCVIGEHTLLTTATTIRELAALQQAKWALWAMDPATQARLRVAELHLHAGFEKSQGAPTEQIYFDLGQVEVSGKLPAPIELAEASEIAQLSNGSAITCVGIALDAGTSLGKFDTPAVVRPQAKVMAVTALDPRHAAVRLLHVNGRWSPMLPGSGILNANGKLVALFAVRSPDEAPLKVCYCPVLPVDALDRDGDTAALWVLPTVEGLAAGMPPAGRPKENR